MNYDDNVDDDDDDETKQGYNGRRQSKGKTVIKLNFYGTCCLFLFVCSFIPLCFFFFQFRASTIYTYSSGYFV